MNRSEQEARERLAAATAECDRLVRVAETDLTLPRTTRAAILLSAEGMRRILNPEPIRQETV